MPINIFSRLTKKEPLFVTVVSGLPRSGTSMMMQILQAGGLQLLTDQLRTADNDNPKGYYEYERVKQLKQGDTAWVAEARGKVVKVISALLEFLPANYNYKVLFMQREMGEILASQKQMMIRRGEPPSPVDDETMGRYFQDHLMKVQNWLAAQPNIHTLYLPYRKLLEQPADQIAAVVDFVGLPLDVDAMQAIPDRALYRQRV